MTRKPGLASRIVRLQVLVLVASLLVGTALLVRLLNATLVSQFERRVLAIAQSVAAEPEIVQAVLDDDPDHQIQQRAEAVRRTTGALFVVVTDERGRRFSHPNPDLLGSVVSTDPTPVLKGETVLAVQRGTLGDSARAKVPLRAPDGRVIGEVSVGISADEISQRLMSLVPKALTYTAVALLLGVLASLALGRRIKRDTFGLEPAEISSLLQEREALLHGVREGVIAFDVDDRITLVNDEARRLLGLPSDALGRPVAELLEDGRLLDVLSGRTSGRDDVVLTGDACLLVNRSSVASAGRPIGAVVTLRDRTEQEALLRELNSVRGLTDALRAQQHEFANRLHVISGLLELGEVDEAQAFLAEVGDQGSQLSRRLQERISDPVVVALLVAKASVARERGVTLRVSDDTELTAVLPDREALVTALGNLVDNAVDAAADGIEERAVDVRIHQSDGDVLIEVTDSGPGVPDADRGRIFTDGFSTKGPHHGLGLALVHRLVRRHGGAVDVTAGASPTFSVRLPAGDDVSGLGVR